MRQSVGVENTPKTNLELGFMVVNNIVGVCLFALIVSNIRFLPVLLCVCSHCSLILSNVNADRNMYEAVVDKTKRYMNSKGFPQDYQKQVSSWSPCVCWIGCAHFPGTTMCGVNTAVSMTMTHLNSCQKSSNPIWFHCDFCAVRECSGAALSH
jgi:hypothetical protein